MPLWAGIAQSVQRLVTSWTVRGSNPGGGGEIIRTRPNSYTTGTGSFPWVKHSGRGVDHPPHLVSRLKKEWSYTSTPLLDRGLL
jgi:aryl-phospho-beta-D-glucosidase BglC (GH1 family)